MPPQQRSDDIPEVDLSDIPDVDISDIPDVGQQEQDPSIFSRGLNWLNTPLFGGAEPTLEEWTSPNAGPETMRRSAWAQATTPLAIAGEVVGGGALGLLGKRLFKGGSTASEGISSLGRIADDVPNVNKPASAVTETVNQAPFNRAEAYKALIARGEDATKLGKMKNADMQALLAKEKPVASPNLPTAVASKPGTRFENFQILEGSGLKRNELGRMKTAELQRMVDELNAKRNAPRTTPGADLNAGPTRVQRMPRQIMDALKPNTGNIELDNMIKEFRKMETARKAHWSKGYTEEEFERFTKLIGDIREHPAFPKQLNDEWEAAGMAAKAQGPKFGPGARVRVKDEVDAAATQREAISNRNQMQVVGGNGGINQPPSGTPPATPPGGQPPNLPPAMAEDVIPEIPPLPPQGPGLWTRANNASRALQSTWDLSFPFRQGAGYAGRKAWRNSWDKMVKAGLNEETAQEINDAIHQREYFKVREVPVVRTLRDGTQVEVFDKTTGLPMMKKIASFAQQAGLDIVDHEEMMAGAGWIKENIKGVKASDRAFTAFSNQVRADAFESLVDEFKKIGIDPTKDITVAKEIAKLVNAGTGRGNLKMFEGGLNFLQNAFFSPKFMASRINMFQNAFNPKRIASLAPGGNPGDRILLKEAWRQLRSLIGVWSTTALLAEGVGGMIDTDPNSADFGKIQVGNTRLDPGAGAQQYLVLMSRMYSGGQTSSTTGRHYQYGSRFGIPTQREAAVDFLANRLGPLPGFVARVMNASKNRPVDINDQTMRLAMPFALQTLIELSQEDPATAALITPLTAVGFGAQTYDESGQGQTVWPESIGGEGYKYRGGSPFNPN